MARKKTKVKIPDGIVDYYVIYSLDKKMGTRELRKELLRKQGELRANMSNGSLNSKEILEKLQEEYKGIAAATKIFKNDERRKEYDLILEAAYEAGRIDVEAQIIAQDLFEEIERMFSKGNYNGVVRKCMEALDNGVHDYRLYILLAQSYFALNDLKHTMNTIKNGLQAHPDNLVILRAGARFSNEGAHDFDESQSYINRMMEIDPDSGIATSEQCYLYLCTEKDDLAYQLMDKYLENHPNDIKFRKDCAYDLIGRAYSCYTKAPDSMAYIIASQEDYQRCLDICNKSASIYNDENVQSALENAKYYGTVEFNDENRENIKWLFLGGIIYLFCGIGLVAGQSAGIGILFFALGILLTYSGIRLKQVSYRPYWQINKFIMTGKREKNESMYVMIGKVFAGYMKWGIKISVGMMKFAFRLAFSFV